MGCQGLTGGWVTKQGRAGLGSAGAHMAAGSGGGALLTELHAQLIRDVYRMPCRDSQPLWVPLFMLPAGLLGELPFGAISMVGARRCGLFCCNTAA